MGSEEGRVARLADVLRKLGCPDPEGTAGSEVQDEIPRTAIFVFLREAWRRVASEEDVAWIEEENDIARKAPMDPFSGAGLALARLRGRGATNEEIAHLVRAMQASLLLALCSLIDDGPEGVEAEAPDVRWALCAIDEEGVPTSQMAGLHESVLTADPTGREMRPPRGWLKLAP